MHTHRHRVLKKLGLADGKDGTLTRGHSLSELSRASGVPMATLQEVYNRGIGAYKTNPESVRLKGSFEKKPAPMSQKLSKEQWAMARVYSFLDGNPKHDKDLREVKTMKLVEIKTSTNPKKKLMAIFQKENGRSRTIHFGQAGADDYTITKDKAQRERYLNRHSNKRESWNKPDSAGALSRWILWGDSTSLAKNISEFKKRFNL